MTKQTVAIKVNQDKLMQNLKFSFSNKSTILGEIMQNARRAGATSVKFETNKSNDLIVLDNGKGISDFQNLFSVAESGWDIDIVKKERPFGMGWLSCLYGSESIYVESNGRCISGLSQSIIAGEGIEVSDSKPIWKGKETYTKIVLSGFTLSFDELKKSLNYLSAGFAINVYLNNELVERTDALSLVNSMPEKFHHVIVPQVGELFIPVKVECSMTARMYLQGLPVYEDRYIYSYGHGYTVVHLDAENIFARMPDRDKLIDESIVLAKVHKAIHEFHLAQLIKMKDSLTPEQFATRGIAEYALSIKGGFNVISDKNVNLSDYFYGDVSDDQPSCYSDADKSQNKFGQEDQSLSIDEFIKGEVAICKIEDMDEYEPSNAAAFILAKKLGWKIVEDVNTRRLVNGVEFNFNNHWVSEFLIELDSEDIEVKINGETLQEEYFFGNWQSPCQVVLCESYKLSFTDKSGKLHEAVVDSEAMLTIDGLLLIPNGCSSDSAASQSAEQGSAYYWEDDFHDDVRDEDVNAFALFLTLLRTGDECEAITGHINNNVNFYDYTKYAGVEFKLVIGKDGHVVVTKLNAEVAVEQAQ